MKTFLSWICLVVTATSSQLACADELNGLENYRLGHYEKAAQALTQTPHEPIADYYLGLMRLYGYGVLKNNSLALSYFNQAGEKGVFPAQWLLARYYLNAEKQPEKALYWFKKAAESGDEKSQMYCAAAYLFGLGVQKNEDVARRYYIDAARNGNALAQYTLGMQFLNSRDQRSKKLGVIWLNKAAALGQVNALLELASLYNSGTLVAKDSNKAYEILTNLTAKGSLSAMLSLGELAWKQGDLNAAKVWFTKVANAHDARGHLQLARLLMEPSSTFYDPKAAFMEMLVAAQDNLSEAQTALSRMYKEGKGVEASQNLASEWESKAKITTSQLSQHSPAIQVARWLTNDESSRFADSDYRLNGIFNDWHNTQALKENNYNQAPQMVSVRREELYKPDFAMVQPSKISISDYFDPIAMTLNKTQANTWVYPRYPLEKHIVALQQSESVLLRHDPLSYVENNAAVITYPSQKQFTLFDYFLDPRAIGWEHKANYQVILSDLYSRAILGDPSAQFDLGQLYQYGVGVAKNIVQAMNYYQLAAMQQNVRAEYNLGILYLEGQTTPIDYLKGVHWLSDAAFKGNAYAQYVLANMYSNGFNDPSGVEVVTPDSQQAIAMYYLAATNHYGPAEYRLADYLVKQRKAGLSIFAQQKRTKLISRLYQDAAAQGVAEANLPLAFYDAMNDSPVKQAHAFSIAKQEAMIGDSNAALLLGMMYERGIAVEVNQVQALAWYLKATESPVSAFILGTYYSQGTGLDQNVVLGKKLLQASADDGFSYAYLNLAILKQKTKEPFLADLDKARQLGNSLAGLLLADSYMAQSNAPEKIQQARDIYQYFAAKGDKDAELKLGYLHDNGLDGTVNHQLAAQWYLAAAEQGQPIAQYLLGQLYQLGQVESEPNYVAAEKWYKNAEILYPKAAIALGFLYDTVSNQYQEALKSYQFATFKSSAVAAFDLGLIYEYGKGVPVNSEKARALYRQAAEHGMSKAMSQLAGLYFMGQGGPQDAQKALQWYTKAAHLGDSEALYQLGLLSETGFATSLDFSNAIRYYQQAAKKGNDKATLALARIYQYGLDGKKNSQEASNLYKELAERGNAYAQYQLALMYFGNTLGEPDVNQGKKLLQQATMNGNRQAGHLLHWIDAQQQEKISFIEPITVNTGPLLIGQTASLMYFNALNEWNRGDEVLSRVILDRLMNQFPNYLPAQRVYKELNQRLNIGSRINLLNLSLKKEG